MKSCDLCLFPGESKVRTFVTTLAGVDGAGKTFKVEEVFVEPGLEEARLSALKALANEVRTQGLAVPDKDRPDEDRGEVLENSLESPLFRGLRAIDERKAAGLASAGPAAS